jgi:hypothetical protein
MKTVALLGVVVAGVAFGCLPLSASAGQMVDLASEIRMLCRGEAFQDDGFSRLAFGQRRDSTLQTMGEEGRLALLRMASSGGRDRPCAITYLANLGDTRVLPIVRMLFEKRNQEATVLLAAIESVGRLKDAQSLDKVLGYAQSDDESLAGAAIAALAVFDDERVLRALRAVLFDPRLLRFQCEVLEILSKRCTPGDLDLLVTFSRAPEVKLDRTGKRCLVDALARTRVENAWDEAILLIEGVAYETRGDRRARRDMVMTVSSAVRERRRKANDASEQDRMDRLLAKLAALDAAMSPE